jgi:hypothetical protein
LVAALVLGFALPANAQSTIKNPGDRPHTTIELEPHVLLGAFDPPGPGPGSDGGFGLGVRGSFEVLQNGFVKSINNSVAIGVGLDVVEYDGDARGECERWTGGPNGTRICTDVDGSGDQLYYLVPVVMQWNFWLARRWSVFGEPGLMLHYEDSDLGVSPFVMYAGGRFHFTDTITLTARIGYPTFSLGVSFLF